MNDWLDTESIRAAVDGRWWRAAAADSSPRGVSIDTRGALEDLVYVAIRGQVFDGNDFAAEASRRGASIVVVERAPRAPGQSPETFPGRAGVLLVDDGRRALGAIAAAWRRRLVRLMTIGVTGSAGKTTTRRLVHAALGKSLRGSASPKSFNNDVGVPLTLLAARPDDDYLVAEIGMNRPGEIAALSRLVAPRCAIVTMVGRAHLAGLGSIEAIAAEKASILEALPEDGPAIVNGDSAPLAAAIEAAIGAGRVRTRRVLRFGRVAAGLDARLTGRTLLPEGQEIELDGRDRFRLRLPGEHNALNAIAAILAARAAGCTDQAIGAGLAEVESEAMRLERMVVGGVTIHNDAYNANPDAMAAALRAFAEISASAQRRVVVLGEMLELGAAAAECHREVGRRAAELDGAAPLAAVVAVGGHAERYREGLAEGGYPHPTRGQVVTLADLDRQGAERVASLLRPGDEVLLKGSRGAAMERLLDALRPATVA